MAFSQRISTLDFSEKFVVLPYFSYGDLDTSLAELIFPGYDYESLEIEYQINFRRIEQYIGYAASFLVNMTPIPGAVKSIISSLI